MRVEATYEDGVPWEDLDQRVLNRRAKRLESALQRLDAEDAHLYVHLAPFGDGEYRCEARLTLPEQVLHTSHAGPRISELLGRALKGLHRELYLYRLRRDPRLRARVQARSRRALERAGMRRGLGYALRRLPEPMHREMVERVIPSLERTAAHEIAIHQAQGEIEPGWFDPLDVVDDVLHDELEHVATLTSVPELAAALELLVVRRVHALARDREMEADTTVRLDEDIPEGDDAEMWENTDLGRDLLDFWVMDEDWVLEDLYSDPTSLDPEELVSNREGLEILLQGLFRLPDEQRRLFAAVVIDGWSVADVARGRGLDEARVRGIVDEAAHTLARTLTGAPAYSTERVYELYEALGRDLGRGRRAEE